MAAEWQIVAFPVILPWREEFWTLPLYFPDLKVGVAPGWPGKLPYQGLPLPPEAEVSIRDLKGFQPGELHQWQAFKEYRQAQEEREEDLIQAIRRYGAAPASEPPSPLDAWRLAWQLEKMMADQEARLVSVDRGQEWLAEILAPEPWEERPQLGPVPGIGEMVDPELAKLRYHLWQRIMTPYLQDHWTPLLLGRTARPIFLTLRGWPQWTGLRAVQAPLPGYRSEEEWARVMDDAKLGEHLAKFRELLSAALTSAADSQELPAVSQKLQNFVEKFLAPNWPLSPLWNWTLEIWGPDPDWEEAMPVLCWAGAGAGVLPG
ncbi:MAG: hypothetical protein HY743_05705 [Deltaproteobacteria bacterium]|nr:hypothetical protein [Deltaproteobacteria bacterium]